MASSFFVTRGQIIYACCLPLAVLMGYMLADPLDSGTLMLVSLVLATLSVPILIHWYHPLLVMFWNAAVQFYFLPGQPFLWMLLSAAGVGLAVLSRITSHESRFFYVPAITWSLVCLTVVVMGTAWFRGGLGVRALGSATYGGRTYFAIFAAVAGYFALASQRVPLRHARLLVGIFFLMGATALIPNLVWMAGPKFMFLFSLFPPLYAVEQASREFSLAPETLRVFGLTVLAYSVVCWLLARYGLRGIFDGFRPARQVLFAAAMLAVLFGGFRSAMLLTLFTLLAQFAGEGLFRARLVAILASVGVVATMLVLPNLERMPWVVQRSLSFLPVKVSPDVRQSAELSSEWRVQMWKRLLEQVPRYLVLGKGYGINPDDLAFAQENRQRGIGEQYDWAITVGVYHNGPLTLIVPFGLGGVVAFGWFLFASLRYMYRKYRDGPPELRGLNTCLLACFLGHFLLFVLVFGFFGTDLYYFTGLIGLSVSLNGEERPKEEEVEARLEVAEEEVLAPVHDRL